MAASYEEIYQLKNSISFMGRLEVGIVHAATQVLFESDTDPNYAKRQKWAKTVLASDGAPRQMVQRMFWRIIYNKAVITEMKGVSDAQILSAISSVVDAFSENV